MGRQSGWCQEAVWKVWGGSLQADCRVKACSLEGVGRLFRVCGSMVVVWRFWVGCLEGVWRLSGESM